MTTGDLIALAAVSINALFYLSGLFKLNATVEILSRSSEKLEKTIEKVVERLTSTEVAMAQIESNCRVYHGAEPKDV